MRAAILGVAAILGFSHGALADDPPYLRGSKAYDFEYSGYQRWSGAYVGGQATYSSVGADFGNATQSLVAFILRQSTLEDMGHVSQWQILDRKNTHGSSYGGFVGYNWQWDQVVLGAEVNYNRPSFAVTTTGSLSRSVTPGDGFTYHTTVDGSASVRITDYSTIRGRAGYVTGIFLPYAALGLAVARAEVQRSATVTALIDDGVNPPVPYGPVTQSESNGGRWGYGFALALGVDVAVLSNVFIRGEYEYVNFPSIGDAKVSFNSVRVAGGLKF